MLMPLLLFSRIWISWSRVAVAAAFIISPSTPSSAVRAMPSQSSSRALSASASVAPITIKQSIGSGSMSTLTLREAAGISSANSSYSGEPSVTYMELYSCSTSISCSVAPLSGMM